MADHERCGGDADARGLSAAMTADRGVRARTARQTRDASRPGSDNPLVRAVARVPVTRADEAARRVRGDRRAARRVAVLGLRVLGQSNSRVVSLGTLQLRAATYQSLQTQAQQLRQMLAVRVAEDPSLNTYLGGTHGRGSARAELDARRRGDRRRALAARAGDERGAVRVRPAARGRSTPPQDQARPPSLRLRRSTRMIASTARARRARGARRFLGEAIDADNDLGALTDRLAATTRAQTDSADRAEPRRITSRRATSFVGVGAMSILLALLLGFVLSRSLVDPTQADGGAAGGDRRR